MITNTRNYHPKTDLQWAIEYLYEIYGEPKDGHLLKEWIKKQKSYERGKND